VCVEEIFSRGSLAPFQESHVQGRVPTSPPCFRPKLLMQPAAADPPLFLQLEERQQRGSVVTLLFGTKCHPLALTMIKAFFKLTGEGYAYIVHVCEK